MGLLFGPCDTKPFPGPVTSRPPSCVCIQPGCQHAIGAGPMDPYLSTDRFVLLSLVAPNPSPFPVRSLLSPDQARMIQCGASGVISHVKALLA